MVRLTRSIRVSQFSNALQIAATLDNYRALRHRVSPNYSGLSALDRICGNTLALIPLSKTKGVRMLKHIGLSLSLCLLAMGLNSLLVTSSNAQQQTQQSAQNVTNGSTTLVEQGSYTNHDGYSVHHQAHTVSGGELRLNAATPATASA